MALTILDQFTHSVRVHCAGQPARPAPSQSPSDAGAPAGTAAIALNGHHAEMCEAMRDALRGNACATADACL